MPRRRIIVEFFEKAFHWLAGVSEKLPVVDTKLFFIVVLSVILGIGVIIAFTLLGSRARKLYVSSKKSGNILPTSTPWTTTTSAILRRIVSPKNAATFAWRMGAIFGSAFRISQRHCERFGSVRQVCQKEQRRALGRVCGNLAYPARAVCVLGLWHVERFGNGRCASCGTRAYRRDLSCSRHSRKKQNQRCLETFEAMQEDLDAKVNLQIESNYATDSSPLQELNSLVEEIIARNTAKAVDIDDNEQTPIEVLIEQKWKSKALTTSKKASMRFCKFRRKRPNIPLKRNRMKPNPQPKTWTKMPPSNSI